ncbi:hypothetical protein [Candidatus Igneacidithiobacillus taiwanensis]|uniref:hypothetical protein n=1 Tax=Candidatus Igneacidithiobacillus taiwanensis TaxID=1945924 RepID=UPI00289AF089|nr:hypothetical protein [Candidatus Igneacidithiobacillus taiwanensis]
MKKTKGSFFRHVLGGLAAIGILTAFVPAATAGLPTSGTCGMLTTSHHLFLNATGTISNGSYKSNAIGPNSVGLSLLAEINFSNKTIYVNGVEAYNNSTTGGPTSYVPGASGQGTFTVVNNATKLPDVTQIQVNLPEGTRTFNLLPVNSGNTILVQEQDGNFVGVCQME